MPPIDPNAPIDSILADLVAAGHLVQRAFPPIAFVIHPETLKVPQWRAIWEEVKTAPRAQWYECRWAPRNTVLEVTNQEYIKLLQAAYNPPLPRQANEESAMIATEETPEEPPTAPVVRDWKAAHRHFLEQMQIYLDLLDMPGAATAPALLIVFMPLLKRYVKGERSEELYEEMMEDRS